MFSRAVRCPVARRRSTASGRRVVEAGRVALDDLGEVGTRRVEIFVCARRRRLSASASLAARKTSGAPSRTVSPAATASATHHAARRRGDDVLHLHRFHHQQRLAGADRRACRRVDARRPCPAAVRARRRVPGGVAGSARRVRRRPVVGRGGEEAAPDGGPRRRRRASPALRIDPVGGDAHRAATSGSLSKRLQESDVGGDAVDAELAERAVRLVDHAPRRRRRARARRPWRAASRSAGSACQPAYAQVSTRTPGPDGASKAVSVPPDGLHRAVGGDRLHVDAHLQREAARRRRGGCEAEVGERAPGGDAELQRHQVDAGDRFGDRVLDLQAGVGLDEEERRAIGRRGRIDQKLEGADAVEVRPPRRGARRRRRAGRAAPASRTGSAPARPASGAGAAACIRVRRDGRRRRAVADDLHLDVARARQELLDVQALVAEGARRLGAAALVRVVQLVRRVARRACRGRRRPPPP